MAPSGRSSRTATDARPPERAQAVWQAAVGLAADVVPGETDEPAVLALLRQAGYDPSTLRHALTLGRTRLRLRPYDVRLGGGRTLLEHATGWLGTRGADGEVGTARAHLTTTAAGPDVRPAGPQG